MSEGVSGGTFTGVFVESRLLVDSALNGLAETFKHLVLLDGYRVVLRRDYRVLNQVKLLSGGWSGVEPMHTGFVGPGVLTGAVVGDHYSSPPVPSILAAIRELSIGNPFGIVIILMNRPYIKINFLLAVEQATRESIPIKVVFVSDDCSGISEQGRGGLAGIALMFKIAGAMAEEQRTMEEIYNTLCEIVSGNIATVNVTVINNIPDKEVEQSKLEDAFTGKFEQNFSGSFSSQLEDNAESVPRVIKILDDLTEIVTTKSTVTHQYSSTLELVNILLGYIVDGSLSRYAILNGDNAPIVILVNNYGSILELELNALINEMCAELRRRCLNIERIYVGTFIGSRNVGGFSVTAMKVTSDLLYCLDYPVIAPGWPTTAHWTSEYVTSLPKRVKLQPYFDERKLAGPILSAEDTNRVRRALEFICLALESCETQVNKMDTERLQTICVGPYGTQVKSLVDALIKDLRHDKLLLNCPYALFSQLSTICSNHLRNENGTFYAVFFDGVSQHFLQLTNDTEIKTKTWLAAMINGIKTVEYYYEIKRGEKVILDSLYSMAQVIKKTPHDYEKIAEAAELSSLRSVDMEQQHSLPEPASHVLALWTRAAAEGLKTCTSKDSVLNQTDIDRKSIVID